MSRPLRKVAGLVLCVLTAGCCSRAWEKRLQSVAKDWCMTIRASQVMPVYPLTEDLQPGDVFLADTAMKEEAKLWRDKGFLPLPRRLKRLHHLNYAAFYQDAYWEGTYGAVPHARPNSLRPEPTDGDGDAGRSPRRGQFGHVAAPRAAFPTYRVDVRSGSGLALAVPIKGVPFAMRLIRAGSATVTVTIDDAYTYGLNDEQEMLARVGAWTDSRAGKAFLKAVYEGTQQTAEDRGEEADKHLFLRLVTRVYLTGALDVTVTKTNVFGGAADVGAAPPLELPTVKDAATAENYEAVLGAVSRSLNAAPDAEAKPEVAEAAVGEDEALAAKMKIGVSVRVAFASGGTVGLRQEFDRPIVIGYRGLDIPIGKDGSTGLPVSTLERVGGSVAAKSGYRFKWFTEQQRELLDARDAFELAARRKGPADQAQAVKGLAEGLLTLIKQEEAVGPRLAELKALEGNVVRLATDAEQLANEMANTVPTSAQIQAAGTLLDRALRLPMHYTSDDPDREARVTQLLRGLQGK